MIKNKSHPGIGDLAEYTAGSLHGSEAEEIREHLSGCPLCRLEIRKIERFESIDQDDDLAEEADWNGARFKLERAFRDSVLPAAGLGARPADRGSRLISKLTWLAPITAAAAVFVLFIHLESTRMELLPSRGMGPMRGDTAEEYKIALEGPSGIIERIPEQFSWKAERDNEYYVLEIFTSDLVNIYKEERIEGTAWAVSDSLISLFEPDSIYLWSVKGYKGLEREEISPNGWVKIVPGTLPASMTQEPK